MKNTYTSSKILRLSKPIDVYPIAKRYEEELCEQGFPLLYKNLTWELLEHVVVLVDEADTALTFSVPLTAYEYDVHLVKTGGTTKAFIQVCKAMMEWMFTNTSCHRLQGRTPRYMRAANHLAAHVGFKREGVAREAWFKDGKFHDLIVRSYIKDE